MSACNAGDPGDDAVELESADSALSCSETESCEDTALRGLCRCGEERHVVRKAAYAPFRCYRAMEDAREAAYATAEANCPVGICNAVERELICEVAPDGRPHALFELTYSCRDLMTCG